MKTNVEMNYIMDVDDIKNLLKEKEEQEQQDKEEKQRKVEKKRVREVVKAQKTKEKRVRLELKQQNTCQGTCGKYSNKDKRWWICDYCGAFTMCPECYNEQKHIMDDHEECCKDISK